MNPGEGVSIQSQSVTRLPHYWAMGDVWGLVSREVRLELQDHQRFMRSDAWPFLYDEDGEIGTLRGDE